MDFLVFVGGIIAFIVTWNVYHVFWSGAGRYVTSPFGYFMRRSLASFLVMLVAWWFLFAYFN